MNDRRRCHREVGQGVSYLDVGHDPHLKCCMLLIFLRCRFGAKSRFGYVGKGVEGQ